MHDSVPVWNKEILLHRVVNNKEIYFTLLDIFIQDMPILGADINQAVLEENYHEITSLVHSLKGTAYNVTADLLGNIAKEIELASKIKNIEIIKEQNKKLQQELLLVIEAFSQEIMKNNSSK